jgi:hypothetical protein
VFGRDHERFGPADHKVWHTAEISSGSVGRSDSVPAGLIPPPVLESINGLLDGLGYLTVPPSPARTFPPSPEEGEYRRVVSC